MREVGEYGEHYDLRYKNNDQTKPQRRLAGRTEGGRQAQEPGRQVQISRPAKQEVIPMPPPRVRSHERKRTNRGNWRKVRSDRGKRRRK
jgi:hypothetical protein